MKRVLNLLMLSTLLACCTLNASADETTKAHRTMATPNAAVVYWQAFAAMPNLNDDEKKLVEKASSTMTAPLTDEVVSVISRYGTSLHELQRARAIPACDWLLDSTAGPVLLLPHLDKARSLSRAAMLRARQRFAAGETDTALDDVIGVFKLARDCAANASPICVLFDASLERSAAEVLAANLPVLTREQLDSVAASLRDLPPLNDVPSSIKLEQQFFCGWLERQIDAESTKLSKPQTNGLLLKAIAESMGDDSDFHPAAGDTEGIRKAEMLMTMSEADVRESLKRLHADFAELQQIATLPFAERSTRLNAFDESLLASGKFMTRDDALRYFSVSLLRISRMAIAREEHMFVRRQLLEQAIRVQRDGENSVQPIDGKKVEYQKTATGFELSCIVGDKPETLTVGIAK